MVFTPYPDFLIIYNSKDVSLSQRLVLPSDYRKYYPTPLPQTALLRKPEGNFWTVKWTISQDEVISFGDGWSKFISDNHPIDRDFLLFSYDGTRNFLVSLFRDGFPMKPEASVAIQEISDDDEKDETAGGDDDDDDYDQNMIISLSLGSSDEEYDNGDTTVCEVNKSHGSLQKGSSSQRIRAQPIDDPEMYIDDPKNPCFIATSSSSRPTLVIAMQVIKDYELKFGSTVKFNDGFGELEGKIGYWKDRVVVHKWQEIYKRNDATESDLIICELLREGGVVRSIKPHFVKS